MEITREQRRAQVAKRIARRWGMNGNGNVKYGYEASLLSRLSDDWPILILSADSATRMSLKNLRARSRDLERNGGIQERYLAALEANVIGSEGVGLQMKVLDAPVSAPPAGERGAPDTKANNLIESEWNAFGRRGNFEVTGKHSRNDFWRITLRSAARDGDVLILVYRGYPNRWRCAFQLLEGDYIDECYNEDKDNGTQIRMGVELDAYRRKVAVWILTKHPGDLGRYGMVNYTPNSALRTRIPILGTDPAAPVSAIHVTRPKRAEETRGVPWITPAMEAIKMLEGYEEAELVAARAQACKHVFFTSEQWTPQGDLIEVPDDSGELVEDMEPGGATNLPPGKKPMFYDPTHPNQVFPEFVKSIKRKIASALNCAYNTLFVDLESVNYSSIRAGLLDEREEWKMKQSWFGDYVVTPSFEMWLELQLLTRTVPYSMTDYDRLNSPTFQFRRWPWVDPRNDAQTAEILLRNKLTTRSQLIHDSSSGDFEDTIDQLDYEYGYIGEKENIQLYPDFGTDTSAQAILSETTASGSAQDTATTLPGEKPAKKLTKKRKLDE